MVYTWGAVLEVILREQAMRAIRTTLLVVLGAALLGTPAQAQEDGTEHLLCQGTTRPNCCGATCGPTQRCCRGTVCSQSGRCIPRECAECGDRGCTVDYETCEATCGPISCCFASCWTDTDCCSGAVCRATSAGARQCVPAACSECTAQGLPCEVTDDCEPVCGTPSCCHALCRSDRDCCMGTACMRTTGNERRCMPAACRDCTGMRPTCQASSECEATCIGPPSCGERCNTNADCGAGALCHQFSRELRLCVPTGFEAACRACGTVGCRFNGTECDVDCVSGY